MNSVFFFIHVCDKVFLISLLFVETKLFKTYQSLFSILVIKASVLRIAVLFSFTTQATKLLLQYTVRCHLFLNVYCCTVLFSSRLVPILLMCYNKLVKIRLFSCLQLFLAYLQAFYCKRYRQYDCDRIFKDINDPSDVRQTRSSKNSMQQCLKLRHQWLPNSLSCKEKLACIQCLIQQRNNYHRSTALGNVTFLTSKDNDMRCSKNVTFQITVLYLPWPCT